MLLAEREVRSVKASLKNPADCFGLPELPRVKRLASEPVELCGLLELAQPYQINRKIGILLRHYWYPATNLSFHRSECVTFPNGQDPTELESLILRSLVRCRADLVMWRE